VFEHGFNARENFFVALDVCLGWAGIGFLKCLTVEGTFGLAALQCPVNLGCGDKCGTTNSFRCKMVPIFLLGIEKANEVHMIDLQRGGVHVEKVGSKGYIMLHNRCLDCSPMMRDGGDRL
jgi:hypothetical protein